MRFIKQWSLGIRSTARISLAEGVFHDLMMTVGWYVDGDGRVFSFGPAPPKQGIRRLHGRRLEGAQAHYLGHEKRWGLTLHDLEVEGSSFCKLKAKETVNGEWATVARFGQHMAMVRAASGEAPVLRFTLVVVQAGTPPPSVESARDASARWIDGGRLLGCGGSVSDQFSMG
jgi:hypothetical protein